MKKIFITLSVMLVAIIGFAQTISPKHYETANPKLTFRKANNLTRPTNNKEKSVSSIYTSYFWSESDMYGGFFTDGGNYYYTGSDINVNFTKDNIDVYRSIAVAFNRIINSSETENPTEILKNNINSMKLDSVMIGLWHTNTSGTENKFIVTILKTDNVGYPTNQVLWKDSISSTTSLSKDKLMTMITFRPNLNIADKKFAVMFQFKGDPTKDTCSLMTGFGSTETCADNDSPIAIESMYYPNTFGMFAWLNDGAFADLFLPVIDTETGEVAGVSSSCNYEPTPYLLQNANISAFLTLDTIAQAENEKNIIKGVVKYSKGYISQNDGYVRLFKTNNNESSELIDSVLIGSNGSFIFSNISEGNYYLHVKLNNLSNYPFVYNTFYNSTFQWQNAKIFKLTTGVDTSITINMVETEEQIPGNGEISGTIVKNLDQEGKKTTNTPVSGAEITAILNKTNSIAGSCLTNSSGQYSIKGLRDGVYSLYVDIPGFRMKETYNNIIVSSTDPEKKNLDFQVDPTGISKIINQNTSIIKTDNAQASIFPNPLFEDNLNITYRLNNSCLVNIELFDMTGKKLSTIINMNQTQGEHQLIINPNKLNITKGIYLIKLTFNNDSMMKKLIIQ